MGVTIILSSHIMDVVERLCPLVAIMSEGRLLDYGTVAELHVRAGTDRLETLFVQAVGGGTTGDLSWL